MVQLTEVAAGILQNKKGDFLLCQRPPNKIYAGFWEFPGGKIEPGESAEVALKREIKEELNLEIISPSPWISRIFTYPHASVHLHFFKIKQWHGELNPSNIEHADFIWQNPFSPLHIQPLLPANQALLSLLQLPEIAYITAAESNGIQNEIQRLEKALLKTSHALVQLRDKTLPNRLEFAKQLAGLCQHHPQSFLVVNDDEKLAQQIGAKGVHFSAQRLKNCHKRPDFALCGASVHSAQELKWAQQLQLDYVFLSPLFPTQTHPHAQPLGKPKFAQLISQSSIPVFALGGVKQEQLSDLQQIGAHGIALLRAY